MCKLYLTVIRSFIGHDIFESVKDREKVLCSVCMENKRERSVGGSYSTASLPTQVLNNKLLCDLARFALCELCFHFCFPIVIAITFTFELSDQQLPSIAATNFTRLCSPHGPVLFRVGPT